ncbi:hypothetical protein SAMN05421803_12282 [Nocardiopsis flavescens]|uniref:Uncharacterized protein n=1 Tax=Nocardiopsis flavescens TaxID=758803 RepID=A0A1M6T887_9ACTN|nr:hypothetical protein [Nocardiopsis flavescens]SHK53160.1 hypothetical protein SAMN05421803_12282 [Nocardiopsis flavescens]
MATLTTPTTAPPIAAEEETCGMCNGTRGTWETGDGASPGKSLRRWVPCTGCNGTGKVGK